MQNIDQIKIMGLKKPEFTKNTVETEDGYQFPNVKLFEYSHENDGIDFSAKGLEFWEKSYPKVPYHEDEDGCFNYHCREIRENNYEVMEYIEDLEEEASKNRVGIGKEMRKSAKDLRRELRLAEKWLKDNQEAIKAANNYDPFTLSVDNAYVMLSVFPDGSHDGIDELRKSYPWPDFLQELEDQAKGDTPQWYQDLKNQYSYEILKLQMSDETYSELTRTAILHLAA